MEERNHWAQIVEETSEGNFLLLKFLLGVMEGSNHWAQIVGETSEGNFFTLTDSFQSAWLVNSRGCSLCAKSNVSIRIWIFDQALCTSYNSCLINFCKTDFIIRIMVLHRALCTLYISCLINCYKTDFT